MAASPQLDIDLWTAPGGGPCTLLGVGRGFVFASRAPASKVDDLIDELAGGATLPTLFTGDDLSPLRDVNEVRLVEARQAGEKVDGPWVLVRRRGKSPLKMSLPGDLDQGRHIVSVFREHLGPTYKVVTIPLSNALWTLISPFIFGIGLLAYWGMLAVPAFFPEWTPEEDEQRRIGSFRVQSKAHFWIKASHFIGRPAIIVLGVVLGCWLGYLAISSTLARPRAQAIRRR